MNDLIHQRAIDLLTQRPIEGVTEADDAWLREHLATCPACSQYESSLSGAAQALRSVRITASSSLVSATQSRLRTRTLELRERESRMFLIGVSFCLGVLSSTVSAWLWWKFGNWLVGIVGLPQSLVGPGVVVFWLLPAIAIAMLMTFVPQTVLNHPLMLSLTREREGDWR